MSAPHLVVVGASLAGLRAVEAARRGGHTGPITLIGAEEHPPYDRPPLSKECIYADVPRDTTFRTEDHLRDELGVELRLGAPATALDIPGHAVEVGDDPVPYDKLIIATGSTVRTMGGTHGLAGVHTLRTVDDSRAIRSGLETARHLVVVGGGFIGSELASAAHAKGVPTTIVEAALVPLVRAVGEEMGSALSGLHVRNGVDLRTGIHVQEVQGTDRVTSVRLSDGAVIPADVVVVGIGAEPATSWLDSSDIGHNLQFGVACDSYLRTSVPDVYAAGDIAHWHNTTYGMSMRLENWTSAAEQGAVAAANALGLSAPKEFGTVPYYWSDWYGARIQFVGEPVADEVQIVMGSTDSDRWVALYRLGDRLVGALTVNYAAVVMKFRIMIGKRTSYAEALDFVADRVAKEAARD